MNPVLTSKLRLRLINAKFNWYRIVVSGEPETN